MDDADAGRHDLEAAEGLHAPLEELVACAVAPELDPHVRLEGVGARPLVDLDGVVDDEGDRDERLDAPGDRGRARSTAERIAARSTSSGTPVKSCRTIRATTNGTSAVRSARGFQAASARTSSALTPLAVAVAKQRLEDHADRDRQAADRAEALALELGERVELAGRAVPEREAPPDALEIAHPAIVLRPAAPANIGRGWRPISTDGSRSRATRPRRPRRFASSWSPRRAARGCLRRSWSPASRSSFATSSSAPGRSGRCPYRTLGGSVSLFGWMLGVAFLLLVLRHRERAIGPFLIPFVVLTTGDRARPSRLHVGARGGNARIALRAPRHARDPRLRGVHLLVRPLASVPRAGSPASPPGDRDSLRAAAGPRGHRAPEPHERDDRSVDARRLARLRPHGGAALLGEPRRIRRSRGP